MKYSIGLVLVIVAIWLITLYKVSLPIVTTGESTVYEVVEGDEK